MSSRRGDGGATGPYPDDMEIIGSSFQGDDREPYGLCRWCAADNSDGQGLALIRQEGEEWYECGWCALAIGDYELFDLDPDEIRWRSAQLREARA